MPSPSGSGVALTILRFCLSTLPFLAVLSYLLYMAVQRGYDADADAGVDDGNADAETDALFSLMDTTIVFLSFHVAWTMFATYLLVFVPKRRYLLDRYLREGEPTLGDVIAESASNKKRMRLFSFRNYGLVVYGHPTKLDPPVLVRKSVRVFQPWTRERVTILRLPNRPLSGQAKTDIEIDLSQMRSERDTTLCYISTLSIFWVLFSLGGAAFCVYQMGEIGDDYLVDNEDANLARRIFLFVVGINPFFAFVVNGIRYAMYYNWMVHWGASVEDENEARNIKTNNWCMYNNDEEASFDGSDQIGYSILGEDRSYAGTVPSHTRSLAPVRPGETHLTVSSVEEDGTALRVLPWTNA
ncbi:unnamed protein product [Pseudo-nitzschia multistriata]|uniref:Uncharacterized protein n=1 Tax=Pseudo-nitzschia multistriata TaxID=183589 RepID=A0A448ZCR5_9STRA|nr:unnamed protein product [Pseudo-nitzschia multistriata]